MLRGALSIKACCSGLIALCLPAECCAGEGSFRFQSAIVAERAEKSASHAPHRAALQTDWYDLIPRHTQSTFGLGQDFTGSYLLTRKRSLGF